MRVAAVLIAGSVLVAACGDNDSGYEVGEELSGGTTTVFDSGRDAFSLTARNLKDARREAFFVGNSIFNRTWVTAPSSTSGMDGLGPTFNASSCSGCHFKDGRGRPPEGDLEFQGLLLRLSVPGVGPHGESIDEPTYGGQFQHRSILGVPAEGKSSVTYVEVPGQFADGTQYSLREPTYAMTDLAFGPMDPATMVSPRVAPFMIGLGLLESLDEATVLAGVDEDDADGDGISGRANYVWNAEAGATQLGRFGWKANQPSLREQTVGAFAGDMGITSSVATTQNCPSTQTACVAAIPGGTPEVDDDKLGAVVYYDNFLAVPARRDFQDPVVLQGKFLFGQLNCTGCHTPKLTTGANPDFPELEHQTIRPFTDLLLHDMGPALADGRPDFLADGNEWRTPPLWGIGLVETVNGHTTLLHDGRARNAMEAVLWHGGEAEAARDAFKSLDADERAALLEFLDSL